MTLASRYNHKRSRQITTERPRIAKSNFISDVRRVEFIFSQTAPVVCLPCKQTDFITRIIALFRVLLYRVSSKKLLKIENTRSNHSKLEFSFSFDLFLFSYFFIPINYYTHKMSHKKDTKKNPTPKCGFFPNLLFNCHSSTLLTLGGVAVLLSNHGSVALINTQNSIIPITIRISAFTTILTTLFPM